MSLVVLAVSQTAVVLGADQIYVDLDADPPSWQTGYRKVFEGAAVVAGVVGAARTKNLPLAQVVQDIVQGAPDLSSAVQTLRAATSGELRSAVAQWREKVGPHEPLGNFATVMFGGLDAYGRPTFVEVTCEETAGGVITWAPSEAIQSNADSTYVGCYGTVSPEAVRRTSFWSFQHQLDDTWQGHVVGPPVFAPAADAAGAEIVEFVTHAVVAGVADEARVPRREWWPAGTPVAAGAPTVVGLEFPARTPQQA